MWCGRPLRAEEVPDREGGAVDRSRGDLPPPDVAGAGRYILNFVLAGFIGLGLTFFLRDRGWLATWISLPIFIVVIVAVAVAAGTGSDDQSGSPSQGMSRERCEELLDIKPGNIIVGGQGLSMEERLECAALLFASPEASTAEDHLNSGIQLVEEEQWEEAIAELDEAIELDPSLAEAFAYRGWAIGNHTGDLTQAEVDFERAIDLDPDLAITYYYRGVAYAHGPIIGGLPGQIPVFADQAIADYTKAIDLDPTLKKAYVNRGNLHARLGHHDLAIADHNKAVELDPTDALGYFNRGVTFRRMGNPEDAIADYGKAIELDPTYAMAYNNRAFAYLELGEFEKALADADKAVQLEPDFAAAYYNRGRSYAGLGESERAIADLEMAISLGVDPGLRTEINGLIEELGGQ